MSAVVVTVVSVLAVVLTLLAMTTLWWQLPAWRTPATLAGVGFTSCTDRGQLTFSLLVYGRREEAVLAATLRGLPPAQRMLARYTLWAPFLQAFTGLAVPVNVRVVPDPRADVVDAAKLAQRDRVEYERPCGRYRRHERQQRHADRNLGEHGAHRLVVGTLAYQLVLAAAALRAVSRELRGQRGWEKTLHVGAHRLPGAATTRAPADGPAGLQPTGWGG